MTILKNENQPNTQENENETIEHIELCDWWDCFDFDVPLDIQKDIVGKFDIDACLYEVKNCESTKRSDVLDLDEALPFLPNAHIQHHYEIQNHLY